MLGRGSSTGRLLLIRLVRYIVEQPNANRILVPQIIKLISAVRPQGLDKSAAYANPLITLISQNGTTTIIERAKGKFMRVVERPTRANVN